MASGPSGPDEPSGPDDGAPESAGSDRRWLWIALAALVALVIGLLLFMMMQDDDDDDPTTDITTSTTVSTTTSSTEATTSTTSGATTTTEADTTTTTAAGTDPVECREAGSDSTDPETPAQTVFTAWTEADEPCAAELMTDDALTELFARDGSGATDEFQGCFEVEDPDPATDCAFTYPGGSTHYLMNFSPTDGWQVFEVNQVAD